jgi:hypothetical protein
MTTQHTPSRRDFLISLGLFGAAMTCGGIAASTAFLLRERTISENDFTAFPTPVTYLRPPGMISRAEWGGLPPNHEAPNEWGMFSVDNPYGWRTYDRALAECYQTIVIHHSVVYEADDPTTMLEIQQFHRQDRGWADVAYHYFIGKSGAIYEGRTPHARGTHVGGYNYGSLGICLLGDFSANEQPTEIQVQNTAALVIWLKGYLNLTHLAGHGEFNRETLCPGQNVEVYLQAFAENAGLMRGTGGYVPPPERQAEAMLPCPACGQLHL